MSESLESFKFITIKLHKTILFQMFGTSSYARNPRVFQVILTVEEVPLG